MFGRKRELNVSFVTLLEREEQELSARKRHDKPRERRGQKLSEKLTEMAVRLFA